MTSFQPNPLSHGADVAQLRPGAAIAFAIAAVAAALGILGSIFS